MICNFEFKVDKEKEFDFYENIQSLFIMLQVMSPIKIKSEHVTNLDGTITLRLNDFEITEDTINDLNQQSLKMMERLGLSL